MFSRLKKTFAKLSRPDWVVPVGIPVSEDQYGGFTLLEKGIYLGGRPNYIPERIQAVLCLSQTMDNCPGIYHAEMRHIPMVDGEYCGDVILEEAIGIIQEWKSENKTSLIHCYSGRSRTGLVAIAYVMNEYHLSLSCAALKVHQTRPIVDPAVPFQIALRDYEDLLKNRGLTLRDDLPKD